MVEIDEDFELGDETAIGILSTFQTRLRVVPQLSERGVLTHTLQPREEERISISKPEETLSLPIIQINSKLLLAANVPEKKEKVKLHSSNFDMLAEAIVNREKQLAEQSTLTLGERMKADYLLSRILF